MRSLSGPYWRAVQLELANRPIGLTPKVGGEVGEFQDLASVLACERSGRLLVLECKHARSTAVKVRFEGLIVFTNGGMMMLEAGIYVAVPHDIAALRLQRAAAEVVRQLNHLHWFRRLLMF